MCTALRETQTNNPGIPRTRQACMLPRVMYQYIEHSGFLPRRMECRRRLAMRILSLSICERRAL